MGGKEDNSKPEKSDYKRARRRRRSFWRRSRPGIVREGKPTPAVTISTILEKKGVQRVSSPLPPVRQDRRGRDRPPPGGPAYIEKKEGRKLIGYWIQPKRSDTELRAAGEDTTV